MTDKGESGRERREGTRAVSIAAGIAAGTDINKESKRRERRRGKDKWREESKRTASIAAGNIKHVATLKNNQRFVQTEYPGGDAAGNTYLTNNASAAGYSAGKLRSTPNPGIICEMSKVDTGRDACEGGAAAGYFAGTFGRNMRF